MAKDGGSEKPRSKPTGKRAATKNEKTQAERFIETARQLGVDESGKNFEVAFRKIIKAPIEDLT